MRLRKRPSRSSCDDDGDSPPADDDDLDDQTKKEFEEFKVWLDANNPAGSSAPPSASHKCPKCGQNECQ